MGLAGSVPQDPPDRRLCHWGSQPEDLCSQKTCALLWSRVPKSYKKTVLYTDFWEAYRKVLPQKRHHPTDKGEGQTCHADLPYRALQQHPAPADGALRQADGALRQADALFLEDGRDGRTRCTRTVYVCFSMNTTEKIRQLKLGHHQRLQIRFGCRLYSQTAGARDLPACISRRTCSLNFLVKIPPYEAQSWRPPFRSIPPQRVFSLPGFSYASNPLRFYIKGLSYFAWVWPRIVHKGQQVAMAPALPLLQLDGLKKCPCRLR